MFCGDCDNTNKIEFIRQIEKRLTCIYSTQAEPSSYNRFHVERVKDFIAGRPAYFNERETERRFTNAEWSLQERLEWIAGEFANMYWVKAPAEQDFDDKRVMFRKEITSLQKATLWCEIAEIQLVPKGLMSPASSHKENIKGSE